MVATRITSMEDRIVNVLLVEDDEVDIMNVKRAFKAKQYFLTLSTLLVMAWKPWKCFEAPPPRGRLYPHSRRIVLLDINMPKMNGIEFLQELRQDQDLRGLLP